MIVGTRSLMAKGNEEEGRKIYLSLLEIETGIVHSQIPSRLVLLTNLNLVLVRDVVWPGRRRRFRGTCCDVELIHAAAIISIDSPSVRTGKRRSAYRVLVGKPEGRRPLGRPSRRWEDIIKMDLREVGWGPWTVSI
jgi:hypothetical protein